MKIVMQSYVRRKYFTIIVFLFSSIQFYSCQPQEVFEALPKSGRLIINQLEVPESAYIYSNPEGGILARYSYAPKNSLERKFEMIIHEKGTDIGQAGILKKNGIWQVGFVDGNRLTYKGIDNTEEEKLIQTLIQEIINKKTFDIITQNKVRNSTLEYNLEELINLTGDLDRSTQIDIHFAIAAKEVPHSMKILEGNNELLKLYRQKFLKNVIEIMVENEWDTVQKNAVNMNIEAQILLNIR